MTNEEFVRHISKAEDSLYRVAKAILKNEFQNILWKMI